MKGERTIIFKYKVIKREARNLERETTMMWNQISDRIRRVTKKVLGEQKGKRHYIKKSRGGVLRFKKPFKRKDLATNFGKRLRIWKIMKCIRQGKKLRK